MVAGGWIKKKPHPEDRRTQSIFTSAKADTVKDELVAERLKANDNILKRFSLEEKLLFKRLLTDVINTE